MPVTSGQVAVGTTATRIYDAGDEPVRLVLRNPSATSSVFTGGSGVTTTNGYELAAGAHLTLHGTRDSSGDFFVIAGVSGSVHYIAY